MRDKYLTVNFEIKVTKKESITKASMKNVFKTLFAIDHKKQAMYFITDTTGKEFCFHFIPQCYGKESMFNWLGYDFELIHEFTEDELYLGSSDVATDYFVSWENGQHRKLDFSNDYLEVNRY